MDQQISFLAASVSNELVREESWMGKDWLVVPVVAITQGIMEGQLSEGPELALADEFAKAPEIWNGRPVTYQHPVIAEKLVSANRRDAEEAYRIGTVYNSVRSDNKLKLEAWLDVARIAELDIADLNTVFEGFKDGTHTAEVSVGAFVSLEPSKGVYNGKSFESIWREVMSDHLAILAPNEIGACSIEDGCGAPRVHARKCSCGGTCDSCKENDMKQQTAIQWLQQHKPDDLRLHMGPQLKTQVSMSNRDREQAILAAMEELGMGGWIVAVYNDMFVYETWHDYILRARTYTIGEDGKISVGGEEQKVRPVTTFVPLNVELDLPSNGEPTMTDNAAGSEAPETPKLPEQITSLEQLATFASPELMSEINHWKAAFGDAHNALVSELLGFEGQPYTEEALRSKTMEELTTLTTFARTMRAQSEAAVAAAAAAAQPGVSSPDQTDDQGAGSDDQGGSNVTTFARPGVQDPLRVQGNSNSGAAQFHKAPSVFERKS